MNVDLMDYVVIEKYACGDSVWKDNVSTVDKVKRLVDFSLEVADVFIAVGAYSENWQRYYEVKP